MTSRAGRGYHADRVIIDEVISDDTMIDALSKARLGDDTEETFRLLAAWRREVHTDSVRVLVDTETAAAAIPGRPPTSATAGPPQGRRAGRCGAGHPGLGGRPGVPTGPAR